MTDFVKFEIKDIEPSEYLENPFLQGLWFADVEADTGDIYKYKCVFKNLFFQIKLKANSEKSRLEVSGSLPKFRHDDNLKDLNLGELRECLKDLNNIIDTRKAILHNLEFGVNIQVSEQPIKILDKFLMYKTTPFEKMGNRNAKNKFKGIECELSQFIIKVYDKGTQAKISENIMRFEIKVSKMQFFQKKNIEVRYLSDLENETILISLGKVLTDIYNDTLKAESINLEAVKSKYRDFIRGAKYPRYWEELHKEDKRLFQRKRKLFLQIQEENKCKDLHGEIKNTLIEKWNNLQTGFTLSPKSEFIKNGNNLPHSENLILDTQKVKKGNYLPLAFSVNNYLFPKPHKNPISKLIDWISEIFKLST